MKKGFIYSIMAALLLLPLTVNAADTVMGLTCEHEAMYSNEENTCYLSIAPGTPIGGVDTSLELPAEISLVKMEIVAEGWQGTFDAGDPRIAIYTDSSLNDSKSLVKITVKSSEVTEKKVVELKTAGVELSDENFDVITISGASTSINLLAGERPSETPGDSNTVLPDGGATNNTTDKESPETGANVVTIIAGVAVLAAGAFVVLRSTSKSRFN